MTGLCSFLFGFHGGQEKHLKREREDGGREEVNVEEREDMRREEKGEGRKGGIKYNNVSQYMEPSQDTHCE